MMGKNWKEGEDKYFSMESGPWAPLRLLRSGLKGDSLSLEYTDQFEISSRRQANVTLRFELSGDEIRPLNRLAREGLDSPPPKGVKR